MQPSEEQQVAIRHMVNGHNVILDAVAGSGKSTTILSMAQLLDHKQILVIAYNSMLRKEMEAKAKKMNITNAQIHTFHSLAVKYYLDKAHTDSGIRKIVYNDMKPRTAKLPKYDIIVLDEAQDMSYLYFQLMVKFAFDMDSVFQLFISGDYMQSLYEFKGADVRTLTMGDLAWQTHPLLLTRIFHKCTLKTSYRITRHMASFVNTVMLGDDRLISYKDGCQVVYMKQSRSNIERFVLSNIQQLLYSNSVGPGDFFILGASVKGVNSYIRKLENVLVERGIPCYVPTFDTEGIDDKIIEGKVVFSTFHSVKGRERKFVFVMGFDQSYFAIYAQNLPKDKCPNTLYVACTRATHKLFLLESDQHSTDRPLDFLKKTHHDMKTMPCVIFNGVPKNIFYERQEPTLASILEQQRVSFHDITPTDLVKFVPEAVIEEITPLLDAIFVSIRPAMPENEIDIPNIIETKQGYYEDVSDLNGIAIPLMYYDHVCRKYDAGEQGSDTLRLIIEGILGEMRDYECVRLKEMFRALPEKIEEPEQYTLLANLYVAAKEKLLYKATQITADDYKWLSVEVIAQCMALLDEIVGDECTDTVPLIEEAIMQYDMDREIEIVNAVLSPHFPNHGKKFRFSARTDLITDTTIWELKCVGSITVEHLLQVILYAWLWQITHLDNPMARNPQCVNPRETKILNVRTGEVLMLNATFEELTIIVVALLRGKYVDIPARTDEEFVDDCVEYIEETGKLYVHDE